MKTKKYSFPARWAALVLFAGLFMCLGFSCQTPKEKPAGELSDAMELIVEPGSHWQGKMKVFIFSIKKTPQMAAWIEDPEGRYIATFSVTERGAKNKWRGAPAEGRLEALPVWNHAVGKNESGESLDAVSSASTKGKVDAKIDGESLVNGNEYRAFLEVNQSFDYNDFWNEGNSGVNGQPSAIYRAEFIAGKRGEVSFSPIGHGSADGADGSINPELKSLTTALEIISSARLIIH